MTDDDRDHMKARRARIETAHGDSETAGAIARAIRPDNTTEMETVVDDDRVVTTVTRHSTGGLHSSVDDYVVNLQVAAQLSTQDGDSSTHDTTQDT